MKDYYCSLKTWSTVFLRTFPSLLVFLLISFHHFPASSCYLLSAICVIIRGTQERMLALHYLCFMGTGKSLFTVMPQSMLPILAVWKASSAHYSILKVRKTWYLLHFPPINDQPVTAKRSGRATIVPIYNSEINVMRVERRIVTYCFCSGFPAI